MAGANLCRGVLALVLVVACPVDGSARGGSDPLCSALGSYPPPDATPDIAIWASGDRDVTWVAPECLGWSSPKATLVVALSGAFRHDASVDDLVGRFGAVSMATAIRYWSVTEGNWRPLVSAASALDGPDPHRRRGDFTAAELSSGRTVHFLQRDSRSSSDVVYAMAVREVAPAHLIIHIENVTALKFFIFTLFAPHTLQATYFLERLSPGVWGYYSVSGLAEGDGRGYEKSFVNRAVALFRHIAGIPTDREPPAAR